MLLASYITELSIPTSGANTDAQDCCQAEASRRRDKEFFAISADSITSKKPHTHTTSFVCLLQST
jgi:hypothetical protein